MGLSTANTNVYPDMTKLLHDFYAIGAKIVSLQAIEGISNTAMNGICTEVKSTRGTVNTAHTSILTLLANN